MGMIQIDVRLFAILRERAGTDRIAVSLPAGSTTAQAVARVWEQLGVEPPLPVGTVAVAVNHEYVAHDVALSDGDELALIPPVSGGAPERPPEDGPKMTAPDQPPGQAPTKPTVHARVSAEPLDQAALHRLVASPRAGAIVIFSGTPRDVPQLDYEAHAPMAEERIAAILQEVGSAHGACAMAAEHRTGSVPWPEPAIVVAVSAPHRGEAFGAAIQALERIKAEAPIWKEEVDGGHRRRVSGTLPPSAPAQAAGALTHLRADGAALMVDVGAKQSTARRALAGALVTMRPDTAMLVQRGDMPKGDVLGIARVAGILAAKRVPELVPLAHPLALTKVDLHAEVIPRAGQVRISAEVRTVGRTGVEIEAMTAALVAAITVYDMVKGVEQGVTVGPVTLIAKSGGKHDYAGPAPWEPPSASEDRPHASSDAKPGIDKPVHAIHMSRPHEPFASLDPPPRVALLTISTSRVKDSDDEGTLALRELAGDLGLEVVAAEKTPDDHDAIATTLRELADGGGCDLVLTAGGTGLSLDDVTPEATRAVGEREVPGIAEALRISSREHTAAWPLSRGIAVARGRTLIVNLPGSPSAAADAVEVLRPLLEHAIGLLRRVAPTSSAE